MCEGVVRAQCTFTGVFINWVFFFYSLLLFSVQQALTHTLTLSLKLTHTHTPSLGHTLGRKKIEQKENKKVISVAKERSPPGHTHPNSAVSHVSLLVSPIHIQFPFPPMVLFAFFPSLLFLFMSIGKNKKMPSQRKNTKKKKFHAQFSHAPRATAVCAHTTI